MTFASGWQQEGARDNRSVFLPREKRQSRSIQESVQREKARQEVKESERWHKRRETDRQTEHIKGWTRRRVSIDWPQNLQTRGSELIHSTNSSKWALSLLCPTIHLQQKNFHTKMMMIQEAEVMLFYLTQWKWKWGRKNKRIKIINHGWRQANMNLCEGEERENILVTIFSGGESKNA